LARGGFSAAVLERNDDEIPVRVEERGVGHGLDALEQFQKVFALYACTWICGSVPQSSPLIHISGKPPATRFVSATR